MSYTDAQVLEKLKLIRDDLVDRPKGQTLELEIRGRSIKFSQHNLRELLDLIDWYSLRIDTSSKVSRRNFARIKR